MWGTYCEMARLSQKKAFRNIFNHDIPERNSCHILSACPRKNHRRASLSFLVLPSVRGSTFEKMNHGLQKEIKPNDDSSAARPRTEVLSEPSWELGTWVARTICHHIHSYSVSTRYDLRPWPAKGSHSRQD